MSDNQVGASTSTVNEDLPPRASSAMSSYGHSRMQPTEPLAEAEEHPRATSALSQRSNRLSYGSSAGRPLAQPPSTIPVRKNVSPAQVFSRHIPVSPSRSYRESGQRRFEKEEARSLRDALEEMDLHDDVRIHHAAQDEASELVWMHQHPGVPYKNPYAPYRNPDVESLGGSSSNGSPSKSSPSRSSPSRTSPSKTQSLRGHRHLFSLPQRDILRTGSLNSPDRHSVVGNEDYSMYSKESGQDDGSPSQKRTGTLRKNLKVNFALPEEEAESQFENENRRAGQRNVSSDSSKGIFRNPDDQIYEEPEDPSRRLDDRPDFSKSDSSALRAKPRNALPRGSRPLPGRFSSLPFVDKLSRFEPHKNPPTQSRNPQYTRNDPSPQPSPNTKAQEPEIPTKDGIEIRSDDIRAATSKKLSDRSTKLPMPSAVSDRVGRPIVSFDPTWKPFESEPKELEGLNRTTASASPTPPPQPPAPTIEVSEAPSIPVINLPDDKEPTISEISGSSRDSTKEAKPRPGPTRDNERRDPSPKKSAPVSQGNWYTPYTRSGVPSARCESCTLPISGKIVTAAGTRFHPECFICYHCQTALECVAFYQEPDAKRNERLADVPIGDEEARAPRFYCHLDFHELFSPRCKSCKTPIEGEVVVACGAEWHVGHFFCAECGDPFDSHKPFVEKDGFAWCLQCHSRRTAPRCLGCKKPVLDDVVITAIGGQWHDQCFVCHECGDDFGAEGRFFVKEGEPKKTAKGRIIGGPVQLAVCERCEGIRLKASP
ncbi:hypothetical protein MW887_009174 [Aspergillus wentii]|nr:hypothetical protein MW887_009174 [Aspergillus wentii]